MGLGDWIGQGTAAKFLPVYQQPWEQGIQLLQLHKIERQQQQKQQQSSFCAR